MPAHRCSVFESRLSRISDWITEIFGTSYKMLGLFEPIFQAVAFTVLHSVVNLQQLGRNQLTLESLMKTLLSDIS